jgi:alpha-L-rhamnosidase
VQSIYQYYVPMIEAGATTVWETLPWSNIQPGKFPTRSHCHAWSSAPVHFLNRIVLGIRPAAPGGSVCDIGPWVEGLTWARGGSVTGRGEVRASWKKEGKTLRIEAEAPAGVRLRYVPNSSHKGLEVFMNGKRRA